MGREPEISVGFWRREICLLGSDISRGLASPTCFCYSWDISSTSISKHVALSSLVCLSFLLTTPNLQEREAESGVSCCSAVPWSGAGGSCTCPSFWLREVSSCPHLHGKRFLIWCSHLSTEIWPDLSVTVIPWVIEEEITQHHWTWMMESIGRGLLYAFRKENEIISFWTL